jgi:hypothetical protein
MGRRAEAIFDIESWDEKPWDDREGAKLTRTRVTKTFCGDLEGDSVAELLMVYLDALVAYLGFERFTGSLHGRAGSFVLKHDAVIAGSVPSASWTVVPDSGSGELRGLRGEAKIAKGPDGRHTFTLDYHLE